MIKTIHIFQLNFKNLIHPISTLADLRPKSWKLSLILLNYEFINYYELNLKIFTF
jgi:hypothetical protein